MGSLFSRAYKRLTQGNQQRSRNDSQSDQHADSARDAKRPTRALVESIPVGQSIDSAEYRALEGNKNVLCLQQQQQQTVENNKENKDFVKTAGTIKDEQEKKKDVEEAVIKIQALVRGHLTRKALKDANQPANGLGQSQFDEESLIKNPLSAIFSPSSLINTVGELRQFPTQQQQQLQEQIQSIGRNDNNRMPLESIAEVVETTAASIGASVQQTANELADLISKQAKAEEEKKDAIERRNNTNRQKLASICQSRAEKQQSQGDNSEACRLDSSLCQSRDSAVSPVPSEANASIDLNTCDTPASASIDILDHNIQQTDRLATVLHPRQDEPAKATDRHSNQQQLSPFEVTTTSTKSWEDDSALLNQDEICTPDSVDSEEAAAIRIQSAFRGYRTRKNSPYRTRSPNSINNGGNSFGTNNKRDALLRQQEAVIVNDDEEEQQQSSRLTEAEELEAEHRVLADGRRESRSKQRDIVINAESRSTESISGVEGDAPSTEEDTATIKEVQLQQNIDSNTEAAAAARPTNDDEDKRLHRVEEAEEKDNQGLSLSLGLSEMAGKLEETAVSLSAALEADPTSQVASLPSQHQDPLPNEQCRAARISIGAKSNDEASFDTDSSVLGAALSLNDETISDSVATTGELSENRSDKQALTSLPTLEESGCVVEADEDMDELESEARRLVEELQNVQDEKDHDQEDDVDLVEATNQLEAALDGEDEEDPGSSVAMNAEEQLAIELESDDIERRDPRGQASEERARSPQISTEIDEEEEPPIELVVAGDNTENPQDETMIMMDNNEPEGASANEEGIVEASEVGGQLMATNLDQVAATSGRSSPANDSSNGSLNGDDSDQKDDDGQSQNQKQKHDRDAGPATTSPSGPKNKKRNRNKKRGKK